MGRTKAKPKKRATKPTKPKTKKKHTLPEAAKKYQFKPGESGNPGGRPSNPITKALKNLTIKTYREVIEVVLTGNLAALQLMVEDPKISALQVGVATAFLTAIKKGDFEIIERIAQRIVGKIPDELNVTGNNTNLNLNANGKTKFDPKKVKAALARLEKQI